MLIGCGVEGCPVNVPSVAVVENLKSLRFALKFGALPMVQEAFERSVDEFSTPLVPPKTFSFSEVLMQLLIPRSREVRRLEGHDRARALEVFGQKVRRTARGRARKLDR